MNDWINPVWWQRLRADIDHLEIRNAKKIQARSPFDMLVIKASLFSVTSAHLKQYQTIKCAPPQQVSKSSHTTSPPNDSNVLCKKGEIPVMLQTCRSACPTTLKKILLHLKSWHTQHTHTHLQTHRCVMFCLQNWLIQNDWRDHPNIRLYTERVNTCGELKQILPRVCAKVHATAYVLLK